MNRFLKVSSSLFRFSSRNLSCVFEQHVTVCSRVIHKKSTFNNIEINGGNVALLSNRLSNVVELPPQYNRYFSTYEHSHDISFEEFRALLDSEAIQVIDVREPEEIVSEGAIPNTINIPLGKIKKALQMDESDFMQKYNVVKPQKHDSNVVFVGLGPIKSSAAMAIAHKFGYKNEPENVALVFSCKAGIRSDRALQKALELGFTKARQYGGGYDEWSERMK